MGAAGLIVGAACFAFLVYPQLSAFEQTDDAQVDAQLTSVSSRIAGTVSAIHVRANQTVQAGELLAELDPTDFELESQAAKANLARAEATLRAEEPAVAMLETGDDTAIKTAQAEIASAEAAARGAERDIDQLEAQRAEADAIWAHATNETRRATSLAPSGALSIADIESRTSAADAAAARLDALGQSLAANKARLGQRVAAIESARARFRELRANAPRRLESKQAALAVARANRTLAKTQLEQAAAQLSYTKIYAPVTGVIGTKLLNQGEAVAPGRQMFTLCAIHDLWVTANFRETQLRHMRAGQSADVYVDALDRTFRGTIDSIAGATGSRFSLLPPENASGNYVKVVQRIPVRIQLAPGQPRLADLRVGMSVEPSVKVR